MLLLALLFALTPDVRHEHIDVIELNHVWSICEETGVPSRVFSQMLFREWNQRTANQTQYDPEITERDFLPKEKRRELRKR